MSRIGRFAKDEGDTKRYVVDYIDWLDDSETISAVTVLGDVPVDDFYIEWIAVDTGGKQIIYYASGGLAEKEYDAVITITTSLSQVKEDWITHVVT
jgi:hypothetical protein